MTHELWVLVSIPSRGWRSRRQTERPGRAIAAAAARPTTPPPMTATSTASITGVPVHRAVAAPRGQRTIKPLPDGREPAIARAWRPLVWLLVVWGAATASNLT